VSPGDARARSTGGPAAPTLGSEGIVGLFAETPEGPGNPSGCCGSRRDRRRQPPRLWGRETRWVRFPLSRQAVAGLGNRRVPALTPTRRGTSLSYEMPRGAPGRSHRWTVALPGRLKLVPVSPPVAETASRGSAELGRIYGPSAEWRNAATTRRNPAFGGAPRSSGCVAGLVRCADIAPRPAPAWL